MLGNSGLFAAVCALSFAIVSGCSSEVAPSELQAVRDGPEQGWVWESSLGIELAVPENWAINDIGCGQTDAPSLVRAPGVGLDCFTPEPKTKQVVEVRSDADQGPSDGLTVEEVSLDGDEPAMRALGETDDGRAFGWLHIPRMQAIVRARVRDERILTDILESVRAVDVDHNGCWTSRDNVQPSAPRAKTLVPKDASALAVCFFGKRQVLLASTRFEGSAAAQLVELLNDAEPGRNPDVPTSRCARSAEDPPPDVFLIAQTKNDRAIVEMSYSGCTRRGLGNGRTTAQLTETLLHAIMAPLDIGYSYQPFPN